MSGSRRVSSKAEDEAGRKGLTGAAKRQYVGGAINRATHEKAESATPAAKAKRQQHSYHREAVADARAQIRYHEAQIAGLREGVKLRGELAGPSTKRTPKPKQPKAPPTIEQQIAAAGGYVPKTPADKLRKTPVRELTDAQLLRDWQNQPPERRRGTLEREMARREAKAAKGQQSAPASRRAQAGAQPAAKVPPIPRFKKGPLKLIREATPGAYSLDATRKVDPYLIRERFGDEQLPRALSMQTENNLGEAVDVVEQKTGKRYTGSKTSRAEMYHWILANMGKPTPPAAPAAPAKPPQRRPPFDRRRDKAIADAIAHGAPEVPPQRPPSAADLPSIQQASEHELRPIKSMEGRLRDPAAPIDPYFLKSLYGDAQLHMALARYTVPRLSEAVRAVQAQHPGTRPSGRDRAALIAYIERYVKD